MTFNMNCRKPRSTVRGVRSTGDSISTIPEPGIIFSLSFHIMASVGATQIKTAATLSEPGMIYYIPIIPRVPQNIHLEPQFVQQT